MSDLTERAPLLCEAITEAFGERCEDFEPDCWCCRAWSELDGLVEPLGQVNEIGQLRGFVGTLLDKHGEGDARISMVKYFANENNKLTVALKEAIETAEYWKVEADGERAKVEQRDKQLDRIAASIAEQVMIMDGQKCRLIIGFETPAKTQEAFDVLGEATGMVKVTPPASALKEKP